MGEARLSHPGLFDVPLEAAPGQVCPLLPSGAPKVILSVPQPSSTSTATLHLVLQPPSRLRLQTVRDTQGVRVGEWEGTTGIKVSSSHHPGTGAWVTPCSWCIMEAVAQVSQLPAMPAPSSSGELVKAQCLQNIIYLLFLYIFIYLAVSCLSCSRSDLRCGFQAFP